MKNDYTHISMVLDRSGSMQSTASDTIGGFNQFIKSQQAEPGECTVTLVQFDDVIETVFDATPVKQVPDLTSATYKPRNSTALYDGIGLTINGTGKFLKDKPDSEKPAKVIFVILTDGMENASVGFDRYKIFNMIKHQREVYNWEFVFIGANQDSLAAGAAVGIPMSHSINYAQNAAGTKEVYAKVSMKMRSARSMAGAGGQSVNSMSWTQDDRDEQNNLGAKTK